MCLIIVLTFLYTLLIKVTLNKLILIIHLHSLYLVLVKLNSVPILKNLGVGIVNSLKAVVKINMPNLGIVTIFQCYHICRGRHSDYF